MISKQLIRKVIESQSSGIQQRSPGVRREALSSMPYLTTQALIITGPYRCGRTTVMLQLLNEDYPEAWYVNFDDPRLYGFDGDDFDKLDDLITESGKGVLFFDKIDAVRGWQEYIARKVDQEFKVVASATLSPHSLAIGQMPLKGKAVIREVYPFSFGEYLNITHKGASESALSEYMSRGGFPDNMPSGGNLNGNGYDNAVRQLLTEGINRDVIIKNGIRDTTTLRRVAGYLLSNCTDMISANKVRNTLGIKAVSTVTEHFAALEEARIVEFIPRLAPKAQQNVNPRRVMVTDTSFLAEATIPDDTLQERLFANVVYLALRRKYRDIFYYAEAGICDFVAYENGEPREVLQVAMTLDHDNFSAKVDATLAAMVHTGLKRGVIVTSGREELLDYDDKVIEVVEAYSYISQ